MKRKGFLFDRICSIENLHLADEKARKGKLQQYGVIQHDKNRENNILLLQSLLRAGSYRTSAYTQFLIYEPKERIINRLPYFPDRIAHHAVMNVLEPIFTAMFSPDSYSCIKGKGIHAAGRAIQKALKNKPATEFCLKLDIRKFYPSIDHEILKRMLRNKFKDADLLRFLDEVIDSAPGLPIGNYLSQYFANYYLTRFDYWLKKEMQVKHYFRYADDVVILGSDKQELHRIRKAIDAYLKSNLKLEVKSNYQVFPVSARGIDFVGYRFFHTHTLLRKSIKKRFARMMAKKHSTASVASYMGWAKHCNSINLIKKLRHA